MKILVIALEFISLALTVVEVRGSANVTRPLCFDKCSQIAGFPGDNCTNLQYMSYGVCSYACTCDGFFGYMQVPDTTPCGNDKVCFVGVCTDIPKDVNCNKYGCCYVAVYDPTVPCAYKCAHKNQCGVYEENKPTGTCCYNSKCQRTGRCDKGICTVEGGDECSNATAASSSSGSGNNNGGGSGGANGTTNATTFEKAIENIDDFGKDLCGIAYALCDKPELSTLTSKLHDYISAERDAETAGLVCSAINSVYDKKGTIDKYMCTAIIVVLLHDCDMKGNVCVSAATKIIGTLFKKGKDKDLTTEDFTSAFKKSFSTHGKEAGTIAFLCYSSYKDCCDSSSAST